MNPRDRVAARLRRMAAVGLGVGTLAASGDATAHDVPPPAPDERERYRVVDPLPPPAQECAPLWALGEAAQVVQAWGRVTDGVGMISLSWSRVEGVSLVGAMTAEGLVVGQVSPSHNGVTVRYRQATPGPATLNLRLKCLDQRAEIRVVMPAPSADGVVRGVVEEIPARPVDKDAPVSPVIPEVGGEDP